LTSFATAAAATLPLDLDSVDRDQAAAAAQSGVGHVVAHRADLAGVLEVPARMGLSEAPDRHADRQRHADELCPDQGREPNRTAA
jgi:hypothetical protein